MCDPENPCQDFFTRNEHNLKKVELLWDERDCLDWEKLTASPHSPGPVEEGETVARVVISPIHIDAATGDIKLSIVSDVKDKGGSTDRLSHTSIADAVGRHCERQRVKNETLDAANQRAIQGYAALRADDVRALLTKDGARAFGIYDTAQAENRAHADICQLLKDKQAGRSARWDLFLLIQKMFVRAGAEAVGVA